MRCSFSLGSLAFVSLVVLTLAGCGGGGSQSVTPVPRTGTSNTGVVITPEVPIVPQDDGRSFTNVAFGGGRFTAVGSNGKMQTSIDGITWVPVAVPDDANLRGVAYGARSANSGTWVAVGDAGTILYSDDGTTWFRTSGIP